MMRKLNGLATWLLIAAVAPMVVHGVPNLIDYQGKLTDLGGTPTVGPVQITFAVYANEADIANLWSETHPTVHLTEGLFHVLLGSVSTMPANLFDGSTRWLGITVESDSEMSPRSPIVSVAYAHRAANADYADTAGNSAPDDDWTIAGGIIHTSKDVGIGTSSLEGNLHVEGILAVNDVVQAADASGLKFQTDEGANRIVITDAGNVGIGIAAPEEKLHVEGTMVVDQVIEADDSGGLGLATDEGTVRIKIKDDGTVGIGTEYPEEQLHVEGTIEVDQRIQANDDGGLEFATDDGVVRMKIADNGNVGIGVTSPISELDVRGTLGLDHTIQGFGGHGIDFVTSDGITRMKIANNGNVGISTTSPEAKLHVEGTIEVDYRIEADDEDGLSFATDDNTTRLKIADSGNVGIGTDTPAYPLHVYRASGNYDVKFDANAGDVDLILDGASGDSAVGFHENGSYRAGVGYSTANDYLFLHEGATTVAVAKNGKFGVGTVNPTEGLDVETSMKVGSTGSPFLGIYQVSGTTHWSSGTTDFSLPSGYTKDNTIILGASLHASSGQYYTLGDHDADLQVIYEPAAKTWQIEHSGHAFFLSRPFRVLAMRME